jgi:hypothetical protein
MENKKFNACGAPQKEKEIKRKENLGLRAFLRLEILGIHWKSVGIHSPEYWLQRCNWVYLQLTVYIYAYLDSLVNNHAFGS